MNTGMQYHLGLYFCSDIYPGVGLRDPMVILFLVFWRTPTLLFKNYLFNFGSVGSLLLCGLLSSCSVWASHCRGFSCCGAWVLGIWASVVVAQGLSSCSSWALEHRLSCSGACGIFPCQPPGTPILFSIVAAATNVLTNSIGGFPFLYILSSNKVATTVSQELGLYW